MAASKKTTQVARRGDCVKLMQALPYRPNLVVADPPFNIGHPYDAYSDNKSHEDYLAWTRLWLSTAVNRLHPHGSLWVFCPDEWVSEIDVLAKREMGLYKRNHVIWAFTFGQKCTKKFSRSHCHLLYFTKTKTKSRFTFNDKPVLVPSARQLVYNDKRAVAAGKPPDDTWMLLKEQLEPCMGKDKDTWLVSRVCGTFKERANFSPNQIPVPLMERIVMACSNPGDRVVDPFAGTGSSGIACALHGRNWEGFDLSARCVAEGNRRIKAALSR